MTGVLPGTIPGLIARAAAEFGDREAVVDGDVRWTFSELAEEIYRVASAVIASGVEPGDRVAVWAPNGRHYITAALGTVTAGAVLVPVNTRFKGDEAAWILGKSGARLLFVANGFLGNDYVGMLRDAADPASTDTAAPAAKPEIVTLSGEGGLPWEEFLARGGEIPPGTVDQRAAAVTDDDISDMFFTSGTTGRPKGVLTAHGQNIRVFTAWADGVGLRPNDRYLIINPMFHTFGYKAGILACLIRGATMVLQPVFDAAGAVRLIEQEKITVMPGAPTLYASILDHPARAGRDLSSLRLAVTGAASVPVTLVERVRKEMFPEVIIAYGLTESCGTVTVGSKDADAETISRTVGQPIADTEVIVADANGNRLRPGENGEVLVHGYNVMRGYFEDPEATAKTIDEDGWLHTGDVGAFDQEGNLRITDRLKDMFVVGGFNAYPAEIEQALARHDKVREAAVIGVPDERLGEVGRAYIIPRQGVTVSEEEIVAFCRGTLANYKVPRSVAIVDALPRNAGGKVLKTQLRAEAAAGAAAETTEAAS
jgi:acyl-CoA synthetase (AMP-forming)/AMP-acid ligase II